MENFSQPVPRIENMYQNDIEIETKNMIQVQLALSLYPDLTFDQAIEEFIKAEWSVKFKTLFEELIKNDTDFIDTFHKDPETILATVKEKLYH